MIHQKDREWFKVIIVGSLFRYSISNGAEKKPHMRIFTTPCAVQCDIL